jgi:multiple sugar transport system substrate-binding protein
MKRLLLVLLVACLLAPFAFAQKFTLDFYFGMTGPDGAYIKNVVEKFMAANPDVKIVPTPYAWATLWTKLDASYAAGKPPQLVAFHIQEVNPYFNKGMLAPIGAELAKMKLDKSDFYPNLLESGQVKGEQYCVPIDVHPIAMYYNVDLFKAAGLNPDKPPTTLQETVDYAKKMTKAGANQWGLGLEQKNDIQFYGFMSFFNQFDGKLVADDYKKATFDGPAARSTMAALHDFVWKHKVTPLGQEDARADFRKKTIGMVFSGPWDNAIEGGFPSQAGLNYRTAPVPQFGPTPATWMSSHQLGVIKQKDKKLIEPSARFIKFFSDNNAEWGQAGMIMVRKSQAASPLLAPIKEQSKGFLDSLPKAKFMPLLPKGWEELFEASPDRAIMKAIQTYMMTEKPDADAILKTANDTLDKILARYYK